MRKVVFIAVSVFFFSFSYGQQVQENSVSKKTQLETNVKQKQVSTSKTDVKEKSMAKFKNMEQYRQENNVPDNFPRYKDTGNQKADLDKYYKAKQKWIKKNPERFEKIKTLNL